MSAPTEAGIREALEGLRAHLTRARVCLDALERCLSGIEGACRHLKVLCGP